MNEPTNDAFNAKFFSKACSTAADAMEQTQEVAQTWKSVSEVLEFAAKNFKEQWCEVEHDGNTLVNGLRSIKMTINSEVKGCTQALRDLDEFLSPGEGATRIKRMAELVELCERFQKVKESGALDAIVELLLKQQ